MMQLKTDKVEKRVKEIETATVEGIIRPFMEERHIKYSITPSGMKILLSIHIKDNMWMCKNVKMNEIDRLLEAIPYLIARPKCIKYDGYGFSITYR